MPTPSKHNHQSASHENNAQPRSERPDPLAVTDKPPAATSRDRLERPSHLQSDLKTPGRTAAYVSIRKPLGRRGQSHFAPRIAQNRDSPQRFSDRL